MIKESNWDAMREELVSILREIDPYPSKQINRTCTCFLSAYQLAVLLYRKNKKLIKDSSSPKNIGGKGEGNYRSLSQYIANSLSHDIVNGTLEGLVEIAFFNINGLEQFSFRDEKGRLSEPSNECFSLFRYAGPLPGVDVTGC